jgi:hypothetical protein
VPELSMRSEDDETGHDIETALIDPNIDPPRRPQLN